jgi:hypothetical protein
MSIAENDAAALVTRLQDNGVAAAGIVGRAVAHDDVWVRLV